MKTVGLVGTKLSAETAEAINKHDWVLPILPNLRELVLGSNFMDLDVGRLFLGPKIDSIDLCSLSSPTSALPFIESITVQCPSLRNLSIDYTTMCKFPLAIADLVLGQVELESLRVGHLTPTLWAHIPALKLQRLEVVRLRARDVGPVSGSGLTQITDLLLGTREDATIFDQFLSLYHLHQLQHLTLDIFGHTSPSSSQWQQCFQTLSRHCSPTLKVLHVSQMMYRKTEHQALLPLLTFRHLTDLSMTGLFFDLNNHILSELARRWPHLQALTLRSPASTSGITLEGILPLLEYCPKLRELALTLNAPLNCVPFSQRPWRGICNRNITTLTVGRSIIEDPVGVAHFFSYILPNLKHIVTREDIELRTPYNEPTPDIDEYNSRWERVIPMMNTKAWCSQEWSPITEHENLGAAS
jgi:hypothetical protein